MRIVFMGTPEFGVPVLRGLTAAGHDVVAVVTQPDRPAGRSGRPVSSPVKQTAMELGIAVLQPERLREPQVIDELRRLAPDMIVVAAFGQLLPRAVLELPRFGALNVHASLLPKYRGAAPIAAAILAGERETGVTIMLMEPGLDTGPILAQRREAIKADDTTESLSRRLAVLGADLLVETLERWVAGELRPQPQDEREASYAPSLRREAGHVDWGRSAAEIERQCRAYYPWPGCYSEWDGRQLKLLAVHVAPEWQAAGEGQRPAERHGRVLRGPAGADLLVATAKGVLAIERLQLEGKRALSAQEFLRGQPGVIGALLR